MLRLQNHLWRLGLESEVYAEHIPDSLERLVKPFGQFEDDESKILFVHHSMGHHVFNQLLSLRAKIVTVYHNITPDDQLDDPTQRYFSRLGRRQLSLLADRSVTAIADSNYNRLEMQTAGFGEVQVIPVQTSFDEFFNARQFRSLNRDWLFVGRIVANKRQVEIVNAFAQHLNQYDSGQYLYLVGAPYSDTYAHEVRSRAERLGIGHRVILTGKVDLQELVNRYSNAGVFVSLSTHEGFGVPLLEAMASGIPVVAYSSGAVPETMGGAGVLLRSGHPHTVSEAVAQIFQDNEQSRRIVEVQDLRLQRICRFNVEEALLSVLSRVQGIYPRQTLQIQGPIETSYSLAALNREVALHLEKSSEFQVSVHPTEGPGDYAPDLQLLSSNPLLEALVERGKSTPFPDVVVRQMYPPRVADTTGSTTIQYFGWEESQIPADIASDFNSHVDRIVVMSPFVKETLVASGVVVPIDVVGVGVSPPQTTSRSFIPELEILRKHRFLHISSAFPRKGVDILLGVYFSEFSGDDDTTLILKTFPNPHNEVGAQLEALRNEHPNPPHVLWINRDLNDEELGRLFAEATTYVNLSRGEGFGLPVAEAMLAEIPVISTAHSGLSLFVSDDTAVVVTSTRSAAATHLSDIGSEWFEPDETAARTAMRSAVMNLNQSQRLERLARAKTTIASLYSWEQVIDRIKESIRNAIQRPRRMSACFVTTFNSKCGIAEYSSLLLAHLSPSVSCDVIADQTSTPLDLTRDEPVLRLWRQERTQDLTRVTEYLCASEHDVVHIQHNFGFFTPKDLAELAAMVEREKPVVITLHRTRDLSQDDELLSISDASEGLRHVSALIVHEQHDVDRLAGMGLSENVFQIPHGSLGYSGIRTGHQLDPSHLRIGTFGFLLPHKGLGELVEAVATLNESGRHCSLTALSALHPDPSSKRSYSMLQEQIRNKAIVDKISLNVDFLTVAEVHSILDAVDVIVLPYSDTPESSSGVLAMLLAIGKPIIATDLDIFSGSRDALLQIDVPVSSQQISETVLRLCDNSNLYNEMAQRVVSRARATNWSTVSHATEELYRNLIASRSRKNVTSLR